MADYTLFSKLKRLFSSGVIVRKTHDGKLKVIDTDDIQLSMTNAMRDRYSKIHVASHGYGMGAYGSSMAYEANRLTLFRAYEIMDQDPLASSALDLIAEESTTKNEYGEILKIESDDENIKEILTNLFYDILNVEFTLPSWIRSLAKYGDFFLFLEISPEYGIHNVMPLSVYDTTRKEGENPNNPLEVYFETMGGSGQKRRLEKYEVAHFRLLSDPNFLPYGRSYLENGRMEYQRLKLMEEAMMIHRIMRAPEKRIFKIDVGNIPAAEIDTYMERHISKTKKTPFIDPQSGEYNLRYNMQNLMEDFYLPVRGSDSGNSIENLGGLEYNAIEDVEYLRNKFFAALKVPKSSLGYGDEANGKMSAAVLDVRFARSIERIHKLIISEFKNIAAVHLYAQGYRDADLVNFEFTLTNPSTIAEQEKINLWSQKAQLIASLQGVNMVDDDWIYKNVLDMSDDEVQKVRDSMVKDKKYKFRLTQIEGGMSDPGKFGFPQDQEPQDDAMGGMSAGGAPGGPTGGTPAPSGPAITSVDQLPTAADLGLEEDAPVEDGRGRPRTGATYGQDSHVRGRDPLGFKSRYKELQIGKKRNDVAKSPLSLETINALRKFPASGQIKTLNEDDAPINFLDERNLIDE